VVEEMEQAEGAGLRHQIARYKATPAIVARIEEYHLHYRIRRLVLVYQLAHQVMGKSFERLFATADVIGRFGSSPHPTVGPLKYFISILARVYYIAGFLINVAIITRLKVIWAS